ncbi:hypothetical protein L195_g026430, partial [Trifolium pratense]
AEIGFAKLGSGWGGSKHSLGSLGYGVSRARPGDLCVRKVGEFNAALLDKWCWRLRTEMGGLWH